MVNKKKRYIGSFSGEEEASRAYDRVSLQYHGNKAKTNHPYSDQETAYIINGPKFMFKDMQQWLHYDFLQYNLLKYNYLISLSSSYLKGINIIDFQRKYV